MRSSSSNRTCVNVGTIRHFDHETTSFVAYVDVLISPIVTCLISCFSEVLKFGLVIILHGIQNASLTLILEFSCDAFQGAVRRGRPKAVAFDGIDKAPEEKKRGITIATVGILFLNLIHAFCFWFCYAIPS
ncbi:hypothetical protein CIPAW_12G020500 [Carya illinoinensis]|uniref:Uncharacterized protein n=1 Tax=Carya illinoinensis TaxID=32201 RepID=A0A8T1NM01_CARIL|nr:hypothetical protein CIPAW_12G020500 [Carya illinoinensis]